MNVLLGSSRQLRRWLPCMWSWCRARLLELSGSATLSGLRWSCAIGPCEVHCTCGHALPGLLQDLASWQKLHREVGGHCYIFSGAAEHLSLLRQQELEPAEGQSDEPFANGTFVQLQPTVSKFCEECQRLQTSPCTVECLLELPERFTALSLELAADLVCVVYCVCLPVWISFVCVVCVGPCRLWQLGAGLSGSIT